MDLIAQSGYKVIYPGLASHPQHELFLRLANPGYGSGGLLTLDLGTIERANRLMECLQNDLGFGLLAVSLGCERVHRLPEQINALHIPRVWCRVPLRFQLRVQSLVHQSLCSEQVSRLLAYQRDATFLSKMNPLNFINMCRYFDTLMSCPAASTSSELEEEELAAAGISPGMVRMSVGLTGSLEQRWKQLQTALTRLEGNAEAGISSWGSEGGQEDSSPE